MSHWSINPEVNTGAFANLTALPSIVARSVIHDSLTRAAILPYPPPHLILGAGADQTSSEATVDRFRYLDSVRGVAAMIVVSAHALAAFFPFAVFGTESFPRHLLSENWFHHFPLSLLSAGYFAVCLFFVLSGYILSFRFIGERSAGLNIIAAAAKRPLRLGGLVLLSLVFAALLWHLDFYRNQEAALISGSVPWLSAHWAGPFDLPLFLERTLTLRGGSQYNQPLWTIQIELIGSFLVFAALLGLNLMNQRWRIACLALAALGLHGSLYQGFVLGILIADLHKHGHLARAKVWILRKQTVRISACLLGLASVMLATYPYYLSKTIRLEVIDPPLEITTTNWATWGAAGILVIVLLSQGLQRFFGQRWLCRLGEWSFAISVLHFPILGSLVCWVFLQLQPLGYLAAAISAMGIGIGALFVLAALATRYVDRPAIRLANAVGYRVTKALQRISQPSRPA